MYVCECVCVCVGVSVCVCVCVCVNKCLCTFLCVYLHVCVAISGKKGKKTVESSSPKPFKKIANGRGIEDSVRNFCIIL